MPCILDPTYGKSSTFEPLILGAEAQNDRTLFLFSDCLCQLLSSSLWWIRTRFTIVLILEHDFITPLIGPVYSERQSFDALIRDPDRLRGTPRLFLYLADLLLRFALQAIANDLFFSRNIPRVDLLLSKLLHVLEDHVSELIVQCNTIMCVFVHRKSTRPIGIETVEISIAGVAFPTDAAWQLPTIGRFAGLLIHLPLQAAALAEHLLILYIVLIISVDLHY